MNAVTQAGRAVDPAALGASISVRNLTVTYNNGSAGYYRWRVYSYSGSGSYTLGIDRP